jgi:hypothetical protein
MSRRYPNARGVYWRSERYGSWPESDHAAFHCELGLRDKHEPFTKNGCRPDFEFWNPHTGLTPQRPLRWNPDGKALIEEVKDVATTAELREFESRYYAGMRDCGAPVIFVGRFHRMDIPADDDRCSIAKHEGFTAAVSQPNPTDKYRCGTWRIAVIYLRDRSGILIPHYYYWPHCMPMPPGMRGAPLGDLDAKFKAARNNVNHNPQIESLFPVLPTVAWRTEPPEETTNKQSG